MTPLPSLDMAARERCCVSDLQRKESPSVFLSACLLYLVSLCRTPPTAAGLILGFAPGPGVAPLRVLCRGLEKDAGCLARGLNG